MENDVMLEQNSYCGKKFMFQGSEYIRIDGVWFKWETDSYSICWDQKLEEIYKSQYGE